MCLRLFVNIFCFGHFEDAESETFIVRLSVEPVELSFVQLSSSPRLRPLDRRPLEATVADGPGKAPEAKFRCMGRRSTATSRLQSFCSQKAPRWTPRTTMARGLKGGRRARNPVSLAWSISEKFFGLEILRKDLHFQ